jgi:site-specific recombinase XerD
VDVAQRQARVWTKGGKEGWLVFGATTAQLLTQYLAQQVPHGRETLFGLTAEEVDSVLDRLAKETGIKCNAHSFRRGFVTELRKVGVGELDIMQLGRWSSVAMVQRYTRAYTFDDAATKYKPIVT